ncbi:hypothetical protein [Streptomyces atratus]|uniref:hypothetical protein n=1 Tax=Streptomyces atratus TaxID=1893 RepID=UPI00340AC6F3
MTHDAGEVFQPTPEVVLGVVPGDPPYRRVEVNGVLSGPVCGVVDVIRLGHRVGATGIDFGDPVVVRGVGGDKCTGMPGRGLAYSQRS